MDMPACPFGGLSAGIKQDILEGEYEKMENTGLGLLFCLETG